MLLLKVNDIKYNVKIEYKINYRTKQNKYQ
jgi:hypothetical protein